MLGRKSRRQARREILHTGIANKLIHPRRVSAVPRMLPPGLLARGGYYRKRLTHTGGKHTLLCLIDTELTYISETDSEATYKAVTNNDPPQPFNG